MTELVLAVGAVYLLGIVVLALSDSICMETLRYILIEWSFDKIERISGDGCGKFFPIYAIRCVIEFIVKWSYYVFIAATLGVLPWIWIPIWFALVLPYLEMKARWDNCHDK